MFGPQETAESYLGMHYEKQSGPLRFLGLREWALRTFGLRDKEAFRLSKPRERAPFFEFVSGAFDAPRGLRSLDEIPYEWRTKRGEVAELAENLRVGRMMRVGDLLRLQGKR